MPDTVTISRARLEQLERKVAALKALADTVEWKRNGWMTTGYSETVAAIRIAEEPDVE